MNHGQKDITLCLKVVQQRRRSRPPEQSRSTLPARINSEISRQHGQIQNELKSTQKPGKMRPIVSCAGTILNHLSRWLNYWLQKIKPFIATYIKDSGQLLDLLRDLGPLPPNTRLFATDANSMYTNIDTDHAL